MRLATISTDEKDVEGGRECLNGKAFTKLLRGVGHDTGRSWRYSEAIEKGIRKRHDKNVLPSAWIGKCVAGFP